MTEHELIEGDLNESCKVDVFDNLDGAINWFRPGRLTVQLLKQLGRWGPEIIE